jgi:hypothetical protein
MKLISVLFKAVTCFSIIVFETPSSYSFFNGSYAVSPSFPNTLSVESHKAPVSLRTRPRAQDSRSRAETPDSAVELDDNIARLVGP